MQMLPYYKEATWRRFWQKIFHDRLMWQFIHSYIHFAIIYKDHLISLHTPQHSSHASHSSYVSYTVQMYFLSSGIVSIITFNWLQLISCYKNKCGFGHLKCNISVKSQCLTTLWRLGCLKFVPGIDIEQNVIVLKLNPNKYLWCLGCGREVSKTQFD